MRTCSFLLAATFFVSDLAAAPDSETLTYSIEWRLIEAGRAKVTRVPAAVNGNSGSQADLHLESVGLVSRLYKVDDDYRVTLAAGSCTQGIFMKANEGKRRRETRVTFDGEGRKASYLEQDLVKNSVVLRKEIDIPACVHDVIGGLYALREQRLELGHFLDMPFSDGKKSVVAKIEAQEREHLKTPAGAFDTVRYEAFLFNKVLYNRQARLFVWLTEDDRRLPVQIRIRLGLAVGTITAQLTKEEHQ